MQEANSNPLPRRIYFSNEADLHLLREVVGQNPYEDPSRWDIIQSNLIQIIGKFISTRTIKDRLNNLVKKFIEKDRTLQFKSGIEEEITEWDDLLRHIVDLINEFKNKKSIKKTVRKLPAKSFKQSNSSYQKGFLTRANATVSCKQLSQSDTPATLTYYGVTERDEEPNDYRHISCDEIETEKNQDETLVINIVENDGPTIVENATEIQNNENGNNISKKSSASRNILTPTRKRAANSIKQSTLAYLTKKNERWYEIRSRELALQERDKSLEEKKFELEAWERKKRIEMEEKKLNIQLNIHNNQQTLMDNQQRLMEIAFQRNT